MQETLGTELLETAGSWRSWVERAKEVVRSAGKGRGGIAGLPIRATTRCASSRR